MAASNGHMEVVSILLEWGADVEAKNNLYDLAVAGDLRGFNAALDSLPLVSSAELSVLQQQSEGKLPIEVARESNSADVELLLTRWSSFYKIYDVATAGDHRGFIAALDVLPGVPPEELAFLHPQSGDSILHVLCKLVADDLHGFDVSVDALSPTNPAELAVVHPQSGDSLLHVTCKQGWVNTADALCRRGADVNVVNKFYNLAVAGDLGGFNDTLPAHSDGSMTELAFLHPQSGDSILHVLCKQGHVSAVAALFKIGFDIKILNKGDSLLHVTCKQGWVDAADALLRRGGDVSAVNKEGHKPIDVARKIKNSAMETLLIRWISFYMLYELAITGSFVALGDALAALSDACPAELTFLHPQSGGRTCLFVAISFGLYSVVDMLLRSGADVSVADQVVAVPEDIRNLLDKTKECLLSARDGFDAESSSEIRKQLYRLEACVAEGTTPNATLKGYNALAFALGLHRTPERRRQENIAAVACLLSRNADIPSYGPQDKSDVLSQPWSVSMKALLEEAIQLKKTGQVVLYKSDLIVVGSGASGKTTLVHRMKWDQFSEGATMTDGIDMTHLRIGQVYFAGRDAAGQSIYAHTISLFFKDDAIYLAVFNPRVENNLDALTQFLHMVQNSSPQARVVLATTRSDELKMDSIMLGKLRRRFPKICGVFPVDSLSGHGVDELRQFLLQEALLQPTTRTVVPASLPRMIDRIVRYAEEHNETFFVSRDQLLSIMGKPDLIEEQQSQLIDQLVSFGTIHRLLSLSNGSDKDPVFILRQQQLADVLACVITKNPVTLTRLKRLSKQGILDHSDDALQCVWGAYPKELWSCGDGSEKRLSIFLRLLHDSGLAYEVFDKFGRPQGRSIVPCILPEKPAGFDDDNSDEAELLSNFLPDYVRSTSIESSIPSLEKLQVSFSSLPSTFFAQLLAGLRKMATDGGVWRNGAVLSAGVSYALLKEERAGISISLYGKNRSVRSVILLTMLQVMKKFRSISISDVTLSVSGRKWHEDDIKESLHYGHGVIHSAKVNIKVEVHSLWMLFPKETKGGNPLPSLSTLLPTTIDEEKLRELQRMVQRAKTTKSMDFIVLINHHLQRCGSPLLHLMGATRPPQGEDALPRPLWVVLQHQTDGSSCAMPFYPHYVPDEPWMALGDAQIPFTPLPISPSEDNTGNTHPPR
eukprot:gene22827-biopygen19779